MRKLTHDEILEQRLSGEQALTVQRHPVIGVLENIRSLYNVGSCFRTADALLLQQLVLTGYTPSPPRREISKTALGATETVPWKYVADTEQALLELKAQGIGIYALELTESSHSLNALPPLHYPIALVVGNEISGVSEQALAHCDGAIAIPMYGVKHSFNVAVAFGIGAWETVKGSFKF